MANNFKQIKKFDSQSNEIGFLFEFNGETQYFTQDDIEIHLKKYFKIRELLKEEKSVRKEYEVVQDAWETYQALMILHRRA